MVKVQNFFFRLFSFQAFSIFSKMINRAAAKIGEEINRATSFSPNDLSSVITKVPQKHVRERLKNNSYIKANIKMPRFA